MVTDMGAYRDSINSAIYGNTLEISFFEEKYNMKLELCGTGCRLCLDTSSSGKLYKSSCSSQYTAKQQLKALSSLSTQL